MPRQIAKTDILIIYRFIVTPSFHERTTGTNSKGSTRVLQLYVGGQKTCMGFCLYGGAIGASTNRCTRTHYIGIFVKCAQGFPVSQFDNQPYDDTHASCMILPEGQKTVRNKPTTLLYGPREKDAVFGSAFGTPGSAVRSRESTAVALCR
eukprot:1006748-Rhodomonas_salina.2